MVKKFKYEEMLPNEFLQAIDETPVFFIPTGLLEWHGDHLPLGLDSLKAYGICLATAEKLKGGIVLPPCYFGRPGFSRYVGTLTFSEACINMIFMELFEQLQKVGAKVMVLLTGHYGPLQVDCIKRVASCYQKEHPEISIIARAEYEGVEIDGMVPADHAGKWETSIFSCFNPELVHMEYFEMETQKKLIYKNPSHDFYKETEEWEWADNLHQTVSVELGQRTIEVITDQLVSDIKKCLSLY